jgi:hypothetical protein
MLINSFDCARRSMGVCQAALTLEPFVNALGLINMDEELDKKIARMESMVAEIALYLDNIVKITHLAVWDLGAEAVQAWDVAPLLKARLATLSEPDVLVYEFQMSQNDKSRMISTMLVYHYADKHIIRMAPAVKNTIVLARNVTREMFARRCPVVANKICNRARLINAITFPCDLGIQTFLKLYTDPYKANKMHTSALLEWWASVFDVAISHIPAAELDDAADSFVQILGALPLLCKKI